MHMLYQQKKRNRKNDEIEDTVYCDSSENLEKSSDLKK